MANPGSQWEAQGRLSGSPEVAVVIVNFRTPDLVVDCLRSLNEDRGRGPDFQVFVVDNDSQDGSATAIGAAVEREGWADWVCVMAAPRNGGFAYGNNFAIRHCLESRSKPRYFWLLNSDTIVHPGALAALVSAAQRDERIGIVGSRLEERDGTPQVASFRFHSIASEFESTARTGPVTRLLRRWSVAPAVPEADRQVEWVSGASMLVATSMLLEIGLLDEDYFLYFEETDFCLRARRQGWSCWTATASRVVHLVGQSTPAKAGQRRPGYWYASRSRYFAKNHGTAYAIGADLAAISGSLLWQVRCMSTGRRSDLPKHYFTDLLRHSISLLAGNRPRPFRHAQ